MIKFITNDTSIDEYSDEIQLSTIEECVEYCKSKQVLGVDTETEGFNFLTKKLIMFQIGDEEQQFVIDTRTTSIEQLRPVLESESIIKILHNAKFDYKFIKKWGNIDLNNIYDTFLAEKILHCGKENYGFGLSRLTERYLSVKLNKEERNQFVQLEGRPFNYNQIRYGAYDVKYLVQIYNEQQPEIDKLDLNHVVKLENKVVKILSEIEYEGIGLDIEKWKLIWETNHDKTFKKQKELDIELLKDKRFKKYESVQFDMFTPESELRTTSINWDSPTQVLSVLSQLIPTLEDVNGKNLYKHKYKFPLIKEYIEYKELSKLTNAYGVKFLKYIHIDQKIHTNFTQVLDTGRMSSSDPNMQQIPADNIYRNCFIAPKDYVFVSGDYKSQELNVIAFGSKDPVWLDALETGQDLHGVCADLVFEDEWRNADADKKKKLRTMIKSINFGLAYGMGPNKLADTLSIDIQEAKDLINKYFKEFPNIKNFLDSLGDFGKRNGYIRTYAPFKRIRWFDTWTPKMYNDQSKFAELGSIERASKNTPIQGSSADITKLALIYIYRAIKSTPKFKDVKIVMTVHDQIDTIAHKDISEEWGKVLTELMEKAGNIVITNNLLKVDTTISTVWEK
jgi:DNA polymerase I-like protein with 3'-5' exonuclease and polymerase domains